MMPNLAIDARSLVGAPAAGRRYTISGRPFQSADATRIYVGFAGLYGDLSDDGTDAIELPASLRDENDVAYTWYVFRLEGLDQEWPFVMPQEDSDLGVLTLEFGSPPVGVGPVPGVSVTDADIDSDGELIITLSSGKEIDAGRARGSEGLPGTDGDRGYYYRRLYLAAATTPVPDSPTALVTPATGAVTGADPWGDVPTEPGDGETLWVSEVYVGFIYGTEGTQPVAVDWGAPFEAGGTGPTGPRGVGIKSITVVNNIMTITYTDDSTAGPFTLPKGDKGDAGVGIASVTEPVTNTMRVTLTNGNHVDFTLPKGDKGTDGKDGVGIKSITDTSNQLTVTLTDDSTQGPFTLPRGPQGEPGTAGSLALTAVGDPVSITDGATGVDGPAVTALTDLVFLDFDYERDNNVTVEMSAIIQKNQIATGFNLQLQGAGGEHVGISENDSKIHFQHDNGSLDDIVVTIYNLTSGTEGPAGRGIKSITEPTDGTLRITYTDDTHTDFTIPTGEVETSAPVSGVGSSSSPITIADGAIAKAKLATGVIPDVSGIATNTVAITQETADRKTEDGKLAGRIDSADVKIAAAEAKLLPTFPSTGDRNDKVPKFHDDTLQWEVDSSANPFSPTQQNIYPTVKPMLEAITASSTVNPIIGTDDDTNSQIKLGVAREIIGEDWGNLVVGHGFHVGNIVLRSSRWYICIKAHAKAGVGPDNDPTNWLVITNWGGTWDTNGWYDPGSFVVHSDEVYVALVAVTSSDPAPDNSANTKWKQLSGGSSGSGGGGVGGYTKIFDKTVSTDATIDLSDYTFAENEVVEFVISSTNADSDNRVGMTMPPSPSDWKTLSGSAFSGNAGTINARNSEDTESIQAVWTGSGQPGASDRIGVFKYVGAKNATIHMIRAAPGGGSRFVPSQSNIFPATDAIMNAGDGIALASNVPAATITASLDLTQALAYPTTKATLKAGDNVHITPNDTGNELVISSDEADPAAPRLYAIDSRDKRNVHPPYSYNFITEGFTLQAGVATREPGPVSRHGYNSAKPGDERDTTNAYNNANGVDFSNSTAGTTTRTKRISVEVTPDNQRSYSAAETLTLQVFADGFVKPNPAPEGQKIYEHVFHFAGGYQDPFNWDFDISYTSAPRSGEHDSWFVHWTWNVGSQQVVAGTIDAVKYTETLPALGSVPTQTFAASAAVALNLLDGYTPPSLKKEVTEDSVVIGLSASGTNYIGTNGPDESDKADVLSPNFTHSSVTYKPWMRAAQDLSQVKITATASARPATTGDVYLCTKAAGLPAQVIGNTRLGAGWTISYTGVSLASQDYYLIVPGGGNSSQAGSPTAAWNANPGNNRINNVIDGIIHNAPLVEGINFSPGSASNVAIEDSQLVEAGRAGLLNKIRLISNGVVSEYSLRGVDRPLPLGSGQVTRCVGPLRVRGSQSGQADTLVYARMYWQTPGGQGPEVQIHFAPTSNPLAGSQSVYLSGVEVEYLVYQ